jgi:hypothetical protein
MKKLAWAMAQFDKKIEYKKALIFLLMLSEQNHKTYFPECSLQSNVEIFAGMYWQQI